MATKRSTRAVPRATTPGTAVFANHFQQACRRLGIPPTRWLLWIQVRRQRMWLCEKMRRAWAGDDDPIVAPSRAVPFSYVERRTFPISTSRIGTGQLAGSNRTPLGLHRVARKIGAGWPAGAVFESRRMVGYTWAGRPGAAITHRILWLEGLDRGLNRGGNVDTFARYIYIHGTGDEPTIGRPASRGCIHVSAADLLPLFDVLPNGTLVWIEE